MYLLLVYDCNQLFSFHLRLNAGFLFVWVILRMLSTDTGRQ